MKSDCRGSGAISLAVRRTTHDRRTGGLGLVFAPRRRGRPWDVRVIYAQLSRTVCFLAPAPNLGRPHDP